MDRASERVGRFLVLSTAAISLLATGCGAASDGSQQQEPQTSASFDELTGALLTPNDLPPGWTAVVAEQSDVAIYPPPAEIVQQLCEPLRELAEIFGAGGAPTGPTVEFHRTSDVESFGPPGEFFLGSLAPGLQQEIYVGDDAMRVMQLSERAVDECADPERTVDAVPIPQIGDRVLASTERDVATSWTFDTVLILRGDAVITLTRSDIIPDAASLAALDLEALSRVAVARYDALNSATTAD